MVDKINPHSSETEHLPHCVWLLNVWGTSKISSKKLLERLKYFAFESNQSRNGFQKNQFRHLEDLQKQIQTDNFKSLGSLCFSGRNRQNKSSSRTPRRDVDKYCCCRIQHTHTSLISVLLISSRKKLVLAYRDIGKIRFMEIWFIEPTNPTTFAHIIHIPKMSQ